MNPLNDHPTARRIAYYIQFVVAGLVLLIGLGYGAADTVLPTWYAVTAAVTSGLWSYLGLTAASNTPTGRSGYVGEHRGEAGQSGVHLALVIVAAVVAAWILIEVLQLLLRT